MRTEKEIEIQKQNDRAFIISAVTTELHNMAYLEYFDAWETNGGMQWFFDECVEITDKIMFSEGSQYLKWLDHWKSTDNDKDVEGFSEFTNETCFDWYHMNEARKEFESRYEKDKCTRSQISEHIGSLLNSVSSDEDRNDLVRLAIKFAEKERERRKDLEEKEKKEKQIKAIIDQLKAIDVDGETMERILRENFELNL